MDCESPMKLSLTPPQSDRRQRQQTVSVSFDRCRATCRWPQRRGWALTDATLKDPALGFVGRPAHSNGTLLRLLVTHGYLPVVACIAGDENGTIYNVNADQMAVSCAVGFGADKLVFLTDVPGVCDSSGDVLQHLTLNGHLGPHRIRCGARRDAAKLEAAGHALESGVQEIVMAPGLQPDVLPPFSQSERRYQSYFLRSGDGGAIDSALTLRKATMRDIPHILALINSYASRGIMLPRTEFEMSENIRDFTCAYGGDVLLGCGSVTLLHPHQRRGKSGRRSLAQGDPSRRRPFS